MTIYLLKAIGVYFVLYSLSVLMNKDMYLKLVKEFNSKNLFPSFMVGFFSLIIGILITLAHSKWDTLPQIIVSAYGWLALSKGVLLLLFPEKADDLCKICSKEKYFKVTGIIMLILGTYICWLAFTQCCSAGCPFSN